MSPIAPGIYSIGDNAGGHVRSYLVQDGDGYILIDTGADTDAKLIRAAVSSPREIKKILISHGHNSHVKGLATIQRMSQAPVLCHSWELDIVEGTRKAERIPFPKPWARPRWNPTAYGLALGLHYGRGTHQPCSASGILMEGQRVGPLLVIETPGHTPGSLSFWHEELRMLFVADTICTWPPPAGPWDNFTLDEKAWRHSIGKLSELPARILCSGHGDPVMEGAQNLIRGMVK